MILFEWLWWVAAHSLYWLMRPFILFFAARNCKRCQHYLGSSVYCHKDMDSLKHCKARPWRPHFVRFKRTKKRKFFDI